MKQKKKKKILQRTLRGTVTGKLHLVDLAGRYFSFFRVVGFFYASKVGFFFFVLLVFYASKVCDYIF